MYSVPKFKVYQDDEIPDGVFDWGPSRDKLFDIYYEASDLYFMGEVQEARDSLRDIIQKDAHFIDAHNMLGNIELELGNYEQSLQHHQKALTIGEKLIPNSFDGRIRWGFTENRPYLRALHSVALDYVYEHDYKAALGLLEKILQYNPDDNQGVRYITGDLYFLQNSYKKAQTTYEENIDYPPYLYSYGLMHYALGNYAKAITFFRKGILSNIYISDYLRMKIPLIPYEIWHATNFEMPETAYAYTDLMFPRWMNYPEALELLQFLHLADPSHSEIQKVYSLKNELYFTNSSFENENEMQEITETILNDIDSIRNNISDSSSKKILKSWEKNAINPGFRAKT